MITPSNVIKIIISGFVMILEGLKLHYEEIDNK